MRISDWSSDVCSSDLAPGLEHPELALLHRELDVLHVAIMRFQQIEHAGKLGIDVRHRLFHRQRLGARGFPRRLRPILRRADARDDILALRVYEELAIIGAVALRRIAGEGATGGGRTPPDPDNNP